MSDPAQINAPRPAYLYFIGDWDPSGKLIPEKIESDLRKFAPESEIHFHRLLITEEQIDEWNLPTKPPKKSSHSKNFTGGSVEAEAIPAKVTRQLLREAIESHLDLRKVSILEIAEESERALLFSVADHLESAA